MDGDRFFNWNTVIFLLCCSAACFLLAAGCELMAGVTNGR